MESLTFDQQLFLSFNKNHSPVLDWLMSLASNALTWIPVYILGFFVLVRVLRFLNPSHYLSNLILVILFLGIDVFICYRALPELFPHFITRVKPCFDVTISSMIHTVGDQCGDKFGFYAFRACTVFALSTFLAFALDSTHKWIKISLILWAIFVSYSRIYLGAHFPVNVFVSALCGILIGYLSYKAYLYIKNSLLVI
jgi:undecaprenyl-diphosphatase